MATACQNPNASYFTPSPLGQPYVVVQTLDQSQGRQRLYLGKTHEVLGILQIIAGCLCFSLEMIGACAGPYWSIFYTGFYTGTFFSVTGLFGYLAFKKKNKCLLSTCLVMSILASSVFCPVGIFMSVREICLYVQQDGHVHQELLQLVKASMIASTCACEFIFSIILALQSCVSCCECCWPLNIRPLRDSRPIPDTVIMQQPNQMNVSNAPVIQQGNALPHVYSNKCPRYPQFGQQNEAFPSWFGASTDSPPPYDQC